MSIFRYHANGFKSFGDAIRYTDQERSNLLAFRNQELSFAEAVIMVNEMDEKLGALEFSYPEQYGLTTKAFVENALKSAVRENLVHEFHSELNL